MRTFLIVAGVGVALCGLSTVGLLALGLMAADDAPASGDCSSTRDGWAQTLTADGVTLRKDGTWVELPWPLPLDDALRSGSVSTNLWNRYLGGRFEPAGLQREQFDDTYTFGAAEARDGSGSVFTALSTGTQNGVAHPVVVVAATQAGLPGSADAVRAMRALNAFPLSCGALAGKWSTSSATAVERFTLSGQFAGVEAVAHAMELTLDANGGYQQVTSGMVHRVYSKETDTGTFTTGDWELVLTPDDGTATAYDAHLIAVRGGFALQIVNRQFKGQAYVLTRTE